MSWLYSRALVEEYLVDTCSDGEQCAPSSGMPTQQAYCSPDKMTEFSRLSRFGMTFKPLMENHGEELLMWYLEDFRARTSAAQGEAQESQESDQECGGTWPALLARYDQDTHSLKTVQCSLLEDLMSSCATLPRWGTMRNGAVYLRQTAALIMRETGYGSSENKWPTPTCHNAKEAGYPEEFKRNTPTLAAQVLIRKIEKFPTPQASDNKDRGHMGMPCIERRKEKGKQIALSQSVSSESGRLNPTWVEWLMGWPQEWTDLQPLGTDKFQEWQQQHLIYSEKD